MRDRKEIEREIKFRAWDKEKKEIRDVTGINWYDEYIWVDKTPMTGDKLPIESTPLMQYTGLKDKNGVEVYEGDVLENDDYTGEVVYDEDEDEARFVLQSYTDGSNGMIAGVKTYSPIEGEIVGNRFENPDLLNTK